MRRMILTPLVLLPVIAHAQAATSTETKLSTSSAAFEAELTQPAGVAELAVKAADTKAAFPVTSLAPMSTASQPLFREVVKTQMVENFSDAALVKGGTLEFAMMGSVPAESSAPKLTQAVEMNLTPQELAEQPAVSNVVVHAIVDENGIPRNVAVTKSAGPAIDRKAIAAVNQYRFKPATLDNKPTWSTVSIAIKIQKP